MIQTEEGLRRTREAVRKLESILVSLERDKETMHPSWYETMREPTADQLCELRSEIDQYLSVVKPSSSDATAALTVPG